MFTKTIIFALATVAVAMPNSSGSMQCGDKKKVSCCNAKSTAELENMGVIPINLLGQINGLLSGCSPLLDVLSHKCTDTTICCEEVNQNGLINVACAPLLS